MLIPNLDHQRWTYKTMLSGDLNYQPAHSNLRANSSPWVLLAARSSQRELVVLQTAMFGSDSASQQPALMKPANMVCNSRLMISYADQFWASCKLSRNSKPVSWTSMSSWSMMTTLSTNNRLGSSCEGRCLLHSTRIKSEVSNRVIF